MGAFEAAENILGKQDATKEEVDQAYANLRNAVFGLRLLPNKDKLEELIQSAEQIDVKLYSEESAKEFMSALSKAKAVFADSEASTQEVEDAERTLAKAMDGLKEVGKAEEQKEYESCQNRRSFNTDFICADCSFKCGNGIFCTEKRRKLIDEERVS